MTMGTKFHVNTPKNREYESHFEHARRLFFFATSFDSLRDHNIASDLLRNIALEDNFLLSLSYRLRKLHTI